MRRSAGGGGAAGTAPRSRPSRRRPSTSPTTTCSPSTTITPSRVRALCVARRAAPAQRLDLQHLDPVGQLDQPLGAGEQPGAEVGGDAEGVDVDPQLVDHPRKLSTWPAE